MQMDHLADLDDIWEACSHMPSVVNKKEFSQNLKNQLPDLKLSNDAVNFLFEQVEINSTYIFHVTH